MCRRFVRYCLKLKRLTLAQTGTQKLEKGKTTKVSASYDGSAGGVKSYKSSNAKVATVSKSGTVTIIATMYNGTKLTTKIAVK